MARRARRQQRRPRVHLGGPRDEGVPARGAVPGRAYEPGIGVVPQVVVAVAGGTRLGGRRGGCRPGPGASPARAPSPRRGREFALRTVSFAELVDERQHLAGDGEELIEVNVAGLQRIPVIVGDDLPALARFWLMRMNADRKIASSETTIVSSPNG